MENGVTGTSALLAVWELWSSFSSLQVPLHSGRWCSLTYSVGCQNVGDIGLLVRITGDGMPKGPHCRFNLRHYAAQDKSLVL
jgi:hypothetical protein